MPSTGTPKIPQFKIILSMCECCCPFFIFCLFLTFWRKVRILTTQKSLTTVHLVNFYRWFQSTTLSDHLSFFCLLGFFKFQNIQKKIVIWDLITLCPQIAKKFSRKKKIYSRGIKPHLNLIVVENETFSNIFFTIIFLRKV